MTETAVAYKMEKIGSDTTVFMFDKLFDYADFIDQTGKEIRIGRAKKFIDEYNSASYVNSKIRSGGARVFGTKDEALVRNKFTDYLFNKELTEFIDGVRNKTVQSDIIDIDQKKKIQFTSQELGIFSFDLASLGLIRVYEYYSKVMNEIVDNNYVRSRNIGDKKVEFYFIGLPAIERHQLKETPDGLWSDLLKREILDSEAEKVDEGDGIIAYFFPEQVAIPEHVVEQRQVKDEQGRQKFTTTWKKSFIHIPKIKNRIPRIDLIINSSYSWDVNGDTQMIWSCMAGVALAEKLQKASINFRVFVSYSASFTGKDVFSFVKVKDANEPININAIAIAASDPRQFRYLAFKGFATTAWKAGYDSYIPYGLGTPINESNKIKKAFIDYLKTQKDFDQAGEKIIEKSKIVFTQALSEREAIQMFDNKVEEISKVK